MPLSAADSVRSGSAVVDACAFDVGEPAELRADAAASVGGIHPLSPPDADRFFDACTEGVNIPDGSEVLPCLSSNNCTENTPKPALGLSQQQKKSACALAWNVQALAEKYGLHRLGFLTLTFADHVIEPKEAQRRFHSLRTHVLAVRYEAFLRVFERQKSGRVHYHLLVVLPFDARTGVDFIGFGRKDYSSASDALRAEWQHWRSTAKKYGFGRTELMPVRSTEEGIGRYVGKYIGKHHAARKSEDRGVRLVQYSTGARMARTRFGWCTENGAFWRAKVRLFAQIMAVRNEVEINGIEDLSKHLGARWAHWHRDFIVSLPVQTAPPGYGHLADGSVYKLSTGEIVCTTQPERSSRAG